MRYIHARDITSERRKYINILFLVTSIVTTVLILFSLVGLISNVSKYVTAKKSLETAQADSVTTEQELKKKVTAITGDEEYANYVISSSNTLSTEKLEMYYPSIDIYSYLGTIEQDVVFYNLDITKEVIQIEGEALSAQDLLNFIDRVKGDSLFQTIKIKAFKYSDDFRVATFALEMYPPEDIRIDVSKVEDSELSQNTEVVDDTGEVLNEDGSTLTSPSEPIPSKIEQAPKSVINGDQDTDVISTTETSDTIEKPTTEVLDTTKKSDDSKPSITIEGLD